MSRVTLFTIIDSLEGNCSYIEIQWFSEGKNEPWSGCNWKLEQSGMQNKMEALASEKTARHDLSNNRKKEEYYSYTHAWICLILVHCIWMLVITSSYCMRCWASLWQLTWRVKKKLTTWRGIRSCVSCQDSQISNGVLLYTGLKEDKIQSRDLEHQFAVACSSWDGFNGTVTNETVADRPADGGPLPCIHMPTLGISGPQAPGH
jgi:hypothetical protein